MISPKCVNVRCYSSTGALIGDYYSNTGKNPCTFVKVDYTLLGGVDTISIQLSNEVTEPLFSGMILIIAIDGGLSVIGYADSIEAKDTEEPRLIIHGKGFQHKLKNVVVNKTYTSQTFDYIIRDICTTYLATAGILYNSGTLSTPTISGISIEFNDKKLNDVLNTLTQIASYSTTKYRYFFGIDSVRPRCSLYFQPVAANPTIALVEGYNFTEAKIETLIDKLINKVFVYRTTLSDDSKTELISSYSNAESISNYGERSVQIVLPSYADSATGQKLADTLLAKYKEPLVKIEIENLDRDNMLATLGSTISFVPFDIILRRINHFKIVNKMESLTGWVTTNLLNVVASISTDQVYTNKTALKFVCSVGCLNSYMYYTLPTPVYNLKFIRFYAYRLEATTIFTVKVYDTFGNVVSIEIGNRNEPINEWIEYVIPIVLTVADGDLRVDKDVSNFGYMIVNTTLSIEGTLGVRDLVLDGVLNASRIDIFVNTNTAGTVYFDEVSIYTNSYIKHTLVPEQIEHALDFVRTTKVVFNDPKDNLIDEIINGNAEGSTAFKIYAKT